MSLDPTTRAVDCKPVFRNNLTPRGSVRFRVSPRPYRLVQGKSWSFWSSCRLTQHLEQGVLTLGVDSGNARPWRRCKVTYRANLPALRQVEILQDANNVRAEGRFERLAVHSAASDVTFPGNANELSLKGAALKADVRLPEANSAAPIPTGPLGLSRSASSRNDGRMAPFIGVRLRNMK